MNAYELVVVTGARRGSILLPVWNLSMVLVWTGKQVMSSSSAAHHDTLTCWLYWPLIISANAYVGFTFLSK